jgi:ribonuclease PH
MYLSRHDAGRSSTQLRTLKVTHGIYPYASGSTLFQMGDTRVLCAVTLQHGVPHFLKGKKSGWLTAEYALLPASTPVRTVREITTNKRSGRTIEISRLIGRSLRAVCDLSVLGEQTIFIDCDVLQADGGTRIACISAAYLALRDAQRCWMERGIINKPILQDEIAAVSVGYSQQEFLLDMDFAEDSKTEVDGNIVVTRSRRFIELQISAERAPLEWDDMQRMCDVAWMGAQELFSFYDEQERLLEADQSTALHNNKAPARSDRVFFDMNFDM